MREHRQLTINSLSDQEHKLKQDERNQKDLLLQKKKELDSENEKRASRNRLIEVEVQQKEAEAENAL